MKISKQLEDALNDVSREVESWPQWKRSLDPQNQKNVDSAPEAMELNARPERVLGAHAG
jgi:hypothetical protein